MTEKCKVTIMPDNITVSVLKGSNLLLAARKAGIFLASPCGGVGTCGKCAVKVVQGNVLSRDDTHLSPELREDGFILACKAKVRGDCIVEIPKSSRLTRHKVVLSAKRRTRERDYFAGKRMNPVCRKITIQLMPPSLNSIVNDWDRLKQVLKTKYFINDPHISLGVLRKLPCVLREKNFEITLTLVFDGKNTVITGIEPGKSGKPALGVAIDVGTTTVVAVLLNLETGKIIEKAGTYNTQSAFGSDVVSRIIYLEEKSDGLHQMQKAILNTINGLLCELFEKTGMSSKDVAVAVCAGNTVMSHFLLGISPQFLRLEPYIPAATSFPAFRAAELGLGISADGLVLIMPSVASYVGGDITSGVLANMLTSSEKLSLFIDIGTNGELVLGNKDWLVACSCSAGPAFEGSGISCGMRAMEGAIDLINIQPDGRIICRTIGNLPPLGICGTGLIYSLSEMLEAGLIDRAGKIIASGNTGMLKEGTDGMELILVPAHESGTGNDIVITESDIKNLLRAKGAIFAGIRCMLRQVQLDIKDIEKVYIAGGFGNFINIEDAIDIGLLPALPMKKFEYVGNSSIQGAMIVLLSREALEEAETLASSITYLELSVGSDFMDEFISALFIPHTNLELFRDVKYAADVKYLRLPV